MKNKPLAKVMHFDLQGSVKINIEYAYLLRNVVTNSGKL